MTNPIKSSGGKVVSFPGSSSQSDTQVPIRRTLVPIGPSLFTPPFDVINELTHSREKYQIHGRENPLTIYAWPDSVVISMELLREWITKPSHPGLFGPTLMCCIINGINVLQDNEDVRELIQLRKEFYSPLELPDAQYFEEVRMWFVSFEILLPESKKKKITVYPSERLKGAISGLATGLGISSWSIALLAAMVTLITQSKILDEHRAIMKNTVNNFYKKVAFRRRIARAMLDLITDKSKPDNSEYWEE